MASTGRLSREHKRNIPKWKKQGMTNEEIADRVNRSQEGIQKFLDECGYVDEAALPDEHDHASLKYALRNKIYWKELQMQFTEHELEVFESLWIEMMINQFRQDLLPVEELSVKQMLTLEILMNRSLVDRKKQLVKIDKLDRELVEEYKVDKDDRDLSFIDHLESQLSYAKGLIGSYTTEHTKLLAQLEKINKDLKATRDQRVKRIEDSKSTFSGLLRYLDDETNRARMGREMELMNVAKDKSLDELSEYHEYIDGEVDIPILNSETVGKHDD